MKTKNLLLFLSFAGLLSLTSGCSMLIASGGKDLDRVFAEKSTRKSVGQQFGPPERFVNYEPPRSLSEVPDLLTFSAPERPRYATNLTTGYGDYRYQGRISEGPPQAYGMVFALTLGAGEILAVPMALWEAAQERKKDHFFRVWYSTTGHCLGYLWRPAEKNKEQPK